MTLPPPQPTYCHSAPPLHWTPPGYSGLVAGQLEDKSAPGQSSVLVLAKPVEKSGLILDSRYLRETKQRKYDKYYNGYIFLQHTVHVYIFVKTEHY